MEEKGAREILDNLGVVRPDGTLGGTGKVYWPARYHLNLPGRPNEVELDGFFSADELEAIAWWMRNKKKGGST